MIIIGFKDQRFAAVISFSSDMFCILSGSMSFTDPLESVLINSMDFWDPCYLKYIFEDDTEQENVNVFNSSISDMELLNSIEKMEWG